MKLHYLFNLDTGTIIAVLPEDNNVHVAEYKFSRDSILDAQLFAARQQLLLDNLKDDLLSQFGVSIDISGHKGKYLITLTDQDGHFKFLSKDTLLAFNPLFHNKEDREYLENYNKDDKLWNATLYFCKHSRLV